MHYAPIFRVFTMDVTLARTFLEVLSAGSFSRAAELLHVTQSTVSSRIIGLEEYLGRQLFVRAPGGVTLTAAGRQFERHALQMVRTWELARQEVSLPSGYLGVLRVGSEAGLWLRLLYRWIPWMQDHAPSIALRVEGGTSDAIMHSVVDGIYDLGVLYTPQRRPGLNLSLITQEDLVLVATPECGEPKTRGAPAPGYVFVDWGQEFRTAHHKRYPDLETPGLVVGIGVLALQHILSRGGSGYFPRSLVKPRVAAGEMYVLEEAPVLSVPVYSVYPEGGDRRVIEPALEGLHSVVNENAHRSHA